MEWIGQFLLDGAHNVNGAKALCKYLDEFVHRPIMIIFGAMKDKNVGGMAKILFRKADEIILTQPENSRAMAAHELLESVHAETADKRITQALSVSEAIKIAREVSSEDGIILITGSLYLVGEARGVLTRQREQV